MHSFVLAAVQGLVEYGALTSAMAGIMTAGRKLAGFTVEHWLPIGAAVLLLLLLWGFAGGRARRL